LLLHGRLTYIMSLNKKDIDDWTGLIGFRTGTGEGFSKTW